MQRDTKALLNDLLVRWHRWAAAPVRVDDSLLRDLDTMINSLAAHHRAGLATQARNLTGGAQVWSTTRASSQDIQDALVLLTAMLAGNENRWYGPRVIKLNLRGNRIGESNPMAELSDHEVKLLLDMRDETNPDGTPKYSLGWLAAKFEIPKSTVSDICSGRRRAQAPARVKVV